MEMPERPRAREPRPRAVTRDPMPVQAYHQLHQLNQLHRRLSHGLRHQPPQQVKGPVLQRQSLMHHQSQHSRSLTSPMHQQSRQGRSLLHLLQSPLLQLPLLAFKLAFPGPLPLPQVQCQYHRRGACFSCHSFSWICLKQIFPTSTCAIRTTTSLRLGSSRR